MTAGRRKLSFATFADVASDLRLLRAGPYTKLGQWSLQQMCEHLANTVEFSLKQPPSDEPTPEQAAVKEKFFGMILGPAGMPEGAPLKPESLPSPDAGEDQIERLLRAQAAFEAWPHPCVEVGRCGPVAKAECRRLHLAHAAHHLSFLLPDPAAAGKLRPQEGLRLSSEAAAIAHVQRLRLGYTPTGKWTLAQICFHDAGTIPKPLEGFGDPVDPTAAEADVWPRLFYYIANGGPPPSFESPTALLPAPACGDAEIEDFIARLRALAALKSPFVRSRSAGVVPTPMLRAFVLAHAAHHFAFLKPHIVRREGLSFADEDAALADVKRLRQGYVQTGNWSLPQIAWHCEKTISFRMTPGPFPDQTAEQTARRPILEGMLASGRIPKITAPDAVVPPPDTGEAAVDAMIAALERWKSFRGPIAPHRLFGHLSEADSRRQNLIHIAHHLSFLVPADDRR